MKYLTSGTRESTSTTLTACLPALLFAILTFTHSVHASDPNIIELTQVNCQFLESENGVDHGFKSNAKSDCNQIHKDSGKERLASSKTIKLTPGDYIFRVTNKDVEYPLGFYLRGEGLTSKVTLPKVSGGGLAPGVTKDYKITLKEGDYVYSCPLNSTLDYKLEVSSN